MITLQIEKPDKKPIAELIEKLDEYLISLYPPECNHLLDIKTLMQPDILFLTAKEGHKYVGCGAIRIVRGQYAEIKRMFVLPGQRGKGIGYKIDRTAKHCTKIETERLKIGNRRQAIRGSQALREIRLLQNLRLCRIQTERHVFVL